MTEPIDFTQSERLPGRAYNGANGKKIAVPLLIDLQRQFCKMYLEARYAALFVAE